MEAEQLLLSDDTTFFQSIIFWIVEGFVKFATDWLMPVMFGVFICAIVLRVLIYWTVKREDWFAKEFEKRVRSFMDGKNCTKMVSFFVTTRRLLEKTFYELFEYRAIMKRRRPDVVLAIGDRVFLIQHGVAILVKDAIKQIKYLKHDGGQPPKLLEISKNVFYNNPCFRKVFGIIPVGSFNDVINILPGMFIIGGIFGTFLGIMQGLPSLGGMNLNDIEGTKQVMDAFLLKMAFSMSTSIIGIVLSVIQTMVNTAFNPERLFIDIVERFENCLDILWNRSENNALPEDMPDFDDARDPIEALAEEAVRNQLAKDKEKILYDGNDYIPKDNEDNSEDEFSSESDSISIPHDDDDISDLNSLDVSSDDIDSVDKAS